MTAAQALRRKGCEKHPPTEGPASGRLLVQSGKLRVLHYFERSIDILP